MIGVQEQQQQQARVAERLNPAVHQQLNLDSVKTRAISLFKAISRILEDFDAIARTNSTPKWHEILGQFSMVNLELFNIVEDIKNVSKAFIVHPKNVNAENATILPIMLSSKLLPEMEMDDNTKREQLLLGMQGLPVALQIERLKGRVDAIAAACESAEKIIADTRKAYFGTRQGPNLLPAVDKAQAAKIQEQETLLRSAVNHGEGLRFPSDQRHVTSALPMHLADILNSGDGAYSFSESSGMYQKSTPLSGNANSPLLQASVAQVTGRAAASPSSAIGNTSFDNTTASSMQFANSPKSGTNIVNMPSPQQQSNQQLQRQLQPKKLMLPLHQQQLLNNPQLRPSSVHLLGQNQLSQMPDISTQAQQKFQQMHGQQHVQYSQALVAQPGRQLGSAPMHMGQPQLTQGSQMTRPLNQFSSAANNAIYNAAQATPASQMISNISAMMPSQTVMPRMPLGMGGVNRTLPSQNLSDQIYNIGSSNAGGMMTQHSNPAAAFVSQGAQNIQGTIQNAAVQNHPNFQQQRPRNQQ